MKIEKANCKKQKTRNKKKTDQNQVKIGQK